MHMRFFVVFPTRREPVTLSINLTAVSIIASKILSSTTEVRLRTSTRIPLSTRDTIISDYGLSG